MVRARRSTVVLLMVAFLMLATPAVLADEGTDTTTGKFAIRDTAPQGIEIGAPDTLTPQTDATITVGVVDVDTLADVDKVTVVLYYQANNGTAKPATSGNPQTAAIMTWQRNGTAWTLDQGGGLTWVLNQSACVKPDDSLTSGVWEFSFKPGTAATQTDERNNAAWRIYVEVTSGGTTISKTYDNRIEMNWYGEISVNTDAVDWGTVNAGSGFAADVNKVTNVSVTYISNGAYISQIMAANTWSGATLAADGETDQANEFALMANASDRYNGAQLVNENPAAIGSGTQTAETGTAVTANTLWLKVADSFGKGLYQGTITYLITSSH